MKCVRTYVLRIRFLGPSAKFRKATMDFVLSVLPSVRTSVRLEKLGSHCSDFHGIWHLGIFRKSIEKIRFSLKAGKNNGYFSWNNIHFLYLPQFFLEWETLQIKVGGSQNSILGSVVVFKKLCHLWDHEKNVVEPGRPPMTIWRMWIACWIPKAKNTFLECVRITFPLNQWLHKRDSMLRHTYIACLLYFRISCRSNPARVFSWFSSVFPGHNCRLPYPSLLKLQNPCFTSTWYGTRMLGWYTIVT